MVGRCMPDSGHGGCSGTRFKTILGSYVGSNFPHSFIYIYYYSWNHVHKVTVSRKDTPLDFSKPYILFKIWHGKTSGDMVGKCMPNSGLGGCPGTGVMTIFGVYVRCHFPNIEYFEGYGGPRALGGISSFSS